MRILTAIVTSLLIPCLLLDPATASSFAPVKVNGSKPSPVFVMQALALRPPFTSRNPGSFLRQIRHRLVHVLALAPALPAIASAATHGPLGLPALLFIGRGSLLMKASMVVALAGMTIFYLWTQNLITIYVSLKEPRQKILSPELTSIMSEFQRLVHSDLTNEGNDQQFRETLVSLERYRQRLARSGVGWKKLSPGDSEAKALRELMQSNFTVAVKYQGILSRLFEGFSEDYMFVPIVMWNMNGKSPHQMDVERVKSESRPAQVHEIARLLDAAGNDDLAAEILGYITYVHRKNNDIQTFLQKIEKTPLLLKISSEWDRLAQIHREKYRLTWAALAVGLLGLLPGIHLYYIGILWVVFFMAIKTLTHQMALLGPERGSGFKFLWQQYSVSQSVREPLPKGARFFVQTGNSREDEKIKPFSPSTAWFWPGWRIFRPLSSTAMFIKVEEDRAMIVPVPEVGTINLVTGNHGLNTLVAALVADSSGQKSILYWHLNPGAYVESWTPAKTKRYFQELFKGYHDIAIIMSPQEGVSRPLASDIRIALGDRVRTIDTLPERSHRLVARALVTKDGVSLFESSRWRVDWTWGRFLRAHSDALKFKAYSWNKPIPVVDEDVMHRIVPVVSDALRAATRFDQPIRVTEFGSGEGDLLARLRSIWLRTEKFLYFQGFEDDPDLLLRGQKKHPELSLMHGDLNQGDSRSLERTQDAVILCNIIQKNVALSADDSAARLIQKAVSGVKPGGILAIWDSIHLAPELRILLEQKGFAIEQFKLTKTAVFILARAPRAHASADLPVLPHAPAIAPPETSISLPHVVMATVPHKKHASVFVLWSVPQLMHYFTPVIDALWSILQGDSLDELLKRDVESLLKELGPIIHRQSQEFSRDYRRSPGNREIPSRYLYPELERHYGQMITMLIITAFGTYRGAYRDPDSLAQPISKANRAVLHAVEEELRDIKAPRAHRYLPIAQAA